MRPIYAQGYYFLVPTGSSWRVHEVVNYYYYDERGDASELLHKPSEYEAEVYRAWEVMQEELEKEEVMINGVKTVPTVNWASLNFLAFAELPYYTFFIEFEGPSSEGVNCFENRFEDWVAEYDYEAFWYLPPGYEFADVLTSCEHEVSDDGRALGIWCRKGDEVKGYERVCWRSI